MFSGGGSSVYGEASLPALEASLPALEAAADNLGAVLRQPPLRLALGAAVTVAADR
jgi:hypothetical protein